MVHWRSPLDTFAFHQFRLGQLGDSISLDRYFLVLSHIPAGFFFRNTQDMFVDWLSYLRTSIKAAFLQATQETAELEQAPLPLVHRLGRHNPCHHI